MNLDSVYSLFNRYFSSHDKKPSVQMGKAVFKSDIDDNLITQAIEIIIYAAHWYIVNGSYSNLYFQKIFKKMKISNALQMHLANNKIPNLIIDFSHIKFNSLKILNLSDNNINNVEPLGWIRFQCIEQIEINFNCVVSIKSMIKIKYWSLRDLRLNQNPINDLKQLNRMSFYPVKTSLRLQSLNHPVLDQDISFLSKMRVQNFSNLICLSSERIFNPSKIKSLLRVYPSSAIQPFQM